jgi:hypothetical protein
LFTLSDFVFSATASANASPGARSAVREWRHPRPFTVLGIRLITPIADIVWREPVSGLYRHRTTLGRSQRFETPGCALHFRIEAADAEPD